MKRHTRRGHPFFLSSALTPSGGLRRRRTGLAEHKETICSDVKHFTHKTPKKRGFKTCKIEKINRLTGCKAGDWQGGQNVFLRKSIALSVTHASLCLTIYMPLACKSTQIGVLKQCFSSKIRIKCATGHAEKQQVTGC